MIFRRAKKPVMYLCHRLMIDDHYHYTQSYLWTPLYGAWWHSGSGVSAFQVFAYCRSEPIFVNSIFLWVPGKIAQPQRDAMALGYDLESKYPPRFPKLSPKYPHLPSGASGPALLLDGGQRGVWCHFALHCFLCWAFGAFGAFDSWIWIVSWNTHGETWTLTTLTVLK